MSLRRQEQEKKKMGLHLKNLVLTAIKTNPLRYPGLRLC